MRDTRRTVTMHDTLILRGRLQVDDGYGKIAKLPAYQYATRDVTVRDSLSPPIVREPFDMVVSGNVRPTTRQMPLDSVILRLRVAPSIVVRDSIRRQFRFSQTAGVTERIIATSLEIGDTAAAVELLTENVFRAAHRLTGGMSSDGARRCH